MANTAENYNPCIIFDAVINKWGFAMLHCDSRTHSLNAVQAAYELKPPCGKDLRKTERLFTFWERLRGARAYPKRSAFDPGALSDLWPYCFLLPASGVECLAFENFGKMLHHPQALVVPSFATGTNEVAPVFDTVRTLSRAAIERGKPEWREDEFNNLWGNNVKFRTIVLPLGDTAASDLLGLISYLEVRRTDIPGLDIRFPLNTS